jgi:hypothetical protein
MNAIDEDSPADPEDTEARPLMPELQESPGDSPVSVPVATPAQASTEASAQEAETSQSRPILSPPPPVPLPFIAVNALPTEDNVNATNVIPLQTVPENTADNGLVLNPPCVFTSQYGRRIHLYQDGSCLSGANVVNGQRALTALPVCLTCQNRFRQTNAEAIASVNAARRIIAGRG